jgi:hypothetical protein
MAIPGKWFILWYGRSLSNRSAPWAVSLQYISNSSKPFWAPAFEEGGYSSSISFILKFSQATSLTTSYLQFDTLMCNRYLFYLNIDFFNLTAPLFFLFSPLVSFSDGATLEPETASVLEYSCRSLFGTKLLRLFDNKAEEESGANLSDDC